MGNDYKSQNEGRYTTLHDYTNLSLLEKIYFRVSPTTIVLRRLFRILDSYKKEDPKIPYKILDVGCGGGIKDLTLRGEVIGVDISEKSLKNAKKIYKKAIVADLSRRYPFPDGSFDVVFCSEVYGHIAEKDKEHFLSEVKRVLKKDGLFLFSCETKGNNWLTRYLLKKGKYKKLWVEHDGHIGLETPQVALKRFEKKFGSVRYMINNSYIFTLDELSTLFPLFSIFFSNTMVRGIGNMLLVPLYELSIRLCSLDSANNICIYGEK